VFVVSLPPCSLALSRALTAMGKANPTAAPRPRVPALVKREVADSRDGEGAEEDTARLQYRGFDKSKLNASRKQQRKEARVNKKEGKAEHQEPSESTHLMHTLKTRKLDKNFDLQF